MKVLTAALATIDVRLTCIRRIVDLDLSARLDMDYPRGYRVRKCSDSLVYSDSRARSLLVSYARRNVYLPR